MAARETPAETIERLLRSGDLPGAARVAGEMIRKLPTSPVARLGRCRAYLQMGMFLEAEQDLDVALRSAPRDELANYLRGQLDIRTGKDRNLMNLRDSMLPTAPTKLTIGDVDAKSLYALNSISRVQLERERHGAFSLNDLVVELSHFLDEEVVNKIETEIFSDKLRNDWGLSKEFKVVETRNKEIGLVLNELEELAWRSAGQLNDKDVDHLKAMLSVKRNRDYFDRQFYDNDMSSLRQFAEAANKYDDRLEKIERWIVRKEDEFQTRVVRPPKNL